MLRSMSKDRESGDLFQLVGKQPVVRMDTRVLAAVRIEVDTTRERRRYEKLKKEPRGLGAASV